MNELFFYVFFSGMIITVGKAMLCTKKGLLFFRVEILAVSLVRSYVNFFFFVVSRFAQTVAWLLLYVQNRGAVAREG